MGIVRTAKNGAAILAALTQRIAIVTIKSTPHYYIEVKLPVGADTEKFVDRIYELAADSIDDMGWFKVGSQTGVNVTPTNDVSIHDARMLDKLVYDVAEEFGYTLESC